MEDKKSGELYGIVDMGSNGIRFSISDLSPPTSRIIPTLFQDRAGISLYDAQFKPGSDTRHPIPEDVQKQVVASLLRFKETCSDFEVPESKIFVLATEATRLAPNSVEFRERIKAATGWEVRMLSKEDEGTIGALGVVSSLAYVQGLVMDLGGGSTQITWIDSKDGIVRTREEGSISFPYGAAALTRRLNEAKRLGDHKVRELEMEIVMNFRSASENLGIPEAMLQRAQQEGGLNLYLSGGGFRGWGYLLMNCTKTNPYPIPTVNGFKVEKADFQNTLAVTSVLSTTESKVFRISERRASQVPAVALLVDALMQALPLIKTVQFCQGGVREGFLFQSFSPQIRSQDPLLVATIPFRTRSSSEISSLLRSCLPVTSESETKKGRVPACFTESFLAAFANIMYAHSNIPKDARPAAALHSTTTGLLCSAHGMSHEDRALLALALYERWSGDLTFSGQQLLSNLREIVSAEEAWWCSYLGRVAALIGNIYPAGVIIQSEPARVFFTASLESRPRPKKGGIKFILALTIKGSGAMNDCNWLFGVIQEGASRIENVGKKKNWIRKTGSGSETEQSGDWGMKVGVTAGAIS